jgi:outer membrane receptor protein involved in Fe transport
MNKEKLFPAVIAVVGICTAPFASHAQTAADQAAQISGQLEEVVITAERRTTDLQKTAVSVAVRNGEDLVREGKSSLAQFLEDVPGVTAVALAGSAVPNDNPGGAVVVRGVPPNPQPAGGDTGVATTALYADGVYAGIGGDYDVDRVEVLRGPQGTLYGRSATSGVVALYSRDPVLGKWGAEVNAEYGSYALQHVSGAVNVPVSDQFAVRLSGNDLYQNGFLGGNKGGSHGVSGGRLKMLYQPTDGFSLILGLAIQSTDSDTGGPSASLRVGAPNTIVINPSPVLTNPVKSTSRQAWVTLNWDVGFANLTYVPAIRTYHNDSQSVVNGLPNFFQITTNHFNLDQVHTEELRLASKAESRVSWIVGAWYYDRKYKYDQSVTWQPSGAYSHGTVSDKSTDNEAIFGEVTYPVLDTLRVTGGLRYDKTRIDSQNTVYVFNLNEGSCSGVFGNASCLATNADYSLPNNIITYRLPAGLGVRTQNNVTYKVRLEKDLTPNNLIYAMASSGFVPGDIAVTTQSIPPSPPGVAALAYDAEKLRSYEVGSKNRFLDNRLQFNTAIYYYTYADYQTFVNIATGMSAPNNVAAANPARMFGAEFEALWQVTANDRLALSAGYTDARFVDKGTPLTTLTTTSYLNKADFFATYVAQTKIFGIAPLTAQASYDHRFALAAGSSVDLGLDAYHTGSYDQGAVSVANMTLGAGPYVKADSQQVYNGHLTWTSASSRFSVTGYVRNIADNVYKTSTAFNGFRPLASTLTVPSPPRIYGVVLHATL